MSVSCAVFYSPGVRRGAQLSLLQEAFKNFDLAATFYPIQDCPKLAAKQDAEIFVAAGGDGTVNCVAAQAYKLGKPLGIVPLGTLNHFAKDIGLPLVLLQAVEIIGKGKTLRVDIGTANGDIFLNNSSIGIYPTIVRARTRLEKRIGKWPAAAAATFLAVNRRLHLYKLRLTLDGKTIERKSSLLFVGNNSYSLKGLGLPTRDNLWHGKLHIFVLKTKRVDRLAKTGIYSLLGKKPPERFIERFEGKNLKVALASRKQLWVSFDGELKKLSIPIEFKLHAKALSVIVSGK